MKKCLNIFFLSFTLVCLKTNAQVSKNTDSLFLIKGYLLEIKSTVNSKESQKLKTEKLTRLIRKATKNKAIFSNNIAKVTDSKKEAAELKSSLNFILQSMVLYKSVIKDNSKDQSEVLYLNKNIPILVDKIYYYCQSAERKQTNKNAKPFSRPK